jgi:hypothetical protein
VGNIFGIEAGKRVKPANLGQPLLVDRLAGARRKKVMKIVADRDEERLERQFQRIEKALPDSVARSLRWLREPSSRWVRIPLGIFLMLGGVVSFLPILGLWMLPLGILLLAQDIPFLRRPTGRALVWLERRWARWKRRRRLGQL